MAAIDPTEQTALIIDEFINYATAHLLTVGGVISGKALYPGVPAVPGPIVLPWTGYVVPPSVSDIPLLGLTQNEQEDVIQQTEEQKKQSEQDQKDFNDLVNNRTETSFTPAETDDEVEAPYGTMEMGGTKRVIGTPYSEIVNNPTYYGSTPQTNFVASNAEARKAAEDYLGRKMTDEEFANLIALVNAEASQNQTERAWVMAVVLNRTRMGYTPAGNKNPNYKFSTVTDIISQRSQFQPVTGTSANPGPNATFLRGPGDKSAKSIYGAATNILNTVPKNYINFTANNPAAYGPGTNLTYLTKLRAKPDSVVHGGTIFASRF